MAKLKSNKVSPADVAAYKKRGYIEKYGRLFGPPHNILTIEMQMFKWSVNGKIKDDPLIYLKNITELIWGEKSTKPFMWNPWAETMANGFFANKWLSVAGAASSGKTMLFSMIAIVMFLINPEETTVIVTSTTLKDSRKRIWGSIKELWNAIPPQVRNSIGKLVDSQGEIRPISGTKTGIFLIAAEKKQEADAVGKMIGFKNPMGAENPFMIIVADELTELSEAVLSAAKQNLSINKGFKFVGLGNPNSYFDPFGVLSEPANGWQSINQSDDEWDTLMGKCIRLDGLKSPNVLAMSMIYPGIIDSEFINEQKRIFGEQSAAFWRMCRGYWCPTGSEEAIYNESEIIQHGANLTTTWLGAEDKIRVAFLDPSFTQGGDKSVLTIGTYGTGVSGLKTFQRDLSLHLKEDLTKSDKETRTDQIVNQFKSYCEQYGVLPENAGFDSTGGGAPFGDAVFRIWSRQVNAINFGTKATELPVSPEDSTPCSKRYTNIVGEIWFSAKHLIRLGQIKGISKEAIQEMCARKFETAKGEQMLIKVESKPDYKARVGKSPDESDSLFGCIFLCRKKFGFNYNKLGQKFENKQSVWDKLAAKGRLILPKVASFSN